LTRAKSPKRKKQKKPLLGPSQNERLREGGKWGKQPRKIEKKKPYQQKKELSAQKETGK